MTKVETTPAPAAEGFDIGSIDTIAASNKGIEFELLNPVDQTPIGVFWSVLGKDSDAFREAIKENIDAGNRRAALARQRGKNIPPQSVDDGEAEAIDLLIVCSTGWRTRIGPKPKPGEPEATYEDTTTVKGQKLAFNVPNARRVLQEFPWIRKQVDDAIGDMERFLKA